MKPEEISKVVKLIEQAAKLNGIKDAFFIGGYPRTLAMGAPLSDVHDIDVGTSHPSHAALLAGILTEKTGGMAEIRHRSGATTVNLGFTEVDFQGPAAHETTLPYLHANDIEVTPLSMNIFDRDFTINSLAIPINGKMEILDLTEKGVRDIQNGRVATILPAEQVVAKDPILITRAIRFAHKYGFSIDGKLWEAMKKHAPELKEKISPERLMIEAEVLSKYNVRKTLEELGLEYLNDMAGEKS